MDLNSESEAPDGAAERTRRQGWHNWKEYLSVKGRIMCESKGDGNVEFQKK